MPEDAPVPFSSHLNELRKRLIWIVLGVFVAFTLVFSLWAENIVRYLQGIAVVQRPVEDAASAINTRPQGSLKVIGFGKPSSSAFTADIALYVVDGAEVVGGEDSGLATVLEAQPGREFTTLWGVLATGATASVDDEKQTVFDMFAHDPATSRMRTIRITVPSSAFMQLWSATPARLAATTGETESHQIRFSTIGALELFSTTMRVSFYAALAFAYPWAMLHIYLFVAPGLYRRERRFFQAAIPGVFVLFFAGAAFGRYILLPISIGFLLDFNVKEFDVQTNYSLGQYLNLVFTMTFGLGFVFQLPLIVAPLIRFGLLTPQFFKRYRKYTLLVAVLLGAIISPTGLVFDMFIAGAPVFFLVEAGVLIGRWWRHSALKQAEREAIRRAEAGEKIDPEALAGGLAIDLEKKLKEFANKGGARKFAQELMRGLREGESEAKTDAGSRSLFDDDYSDSDKPPAEVKLKPRTPPPQAATTPTTKPDQVFTPAVPAPAAAPGAGASEKMDIEAAAGGNGAQKDWPDRPWVEGVDEKTAQYIEDRVSQRLQQFMDKDLRPWMARVEDELRQRRED